jgi:NADH-quinone oxidoreductase subunit C
MVDEPKDPPAPATPAKAAGDKPASGAPGEPLKAEVSRTDSPGAGASAAPVAQPAATPAPKPENPAAATTATTSETSSATGKPTAPAAPKVAEAASKPPAPKAPAAAHDTKPAPPAGPTDPPPPAGAEIPAFIAKLQAAVPGAVEQVSFYVGDWTAIVPAGKLLEAARFLRDSPELAFDFCSDVTASDWPTRPQRFDVIYCLYSTRFHSRLRLKVRAAEKDPVPSVCVIWPAANWLEREVYDLFGVNFVGHPDLRRILMPDDWQGFPQRKDYPLEGPGELLMENPLDWLKLRQSQEESEIE